VGDRFRSGQFSSERCGRQIPMKRVNIGEIWATGLSSEGFRWRDVDDRFEFGGFSLRHVPIGRVNIGAL
jgi:hypothetical protein